MIVSHGDTISAEEMERGARCAAEVLLQTMPQLLQVRALWHCQAPLLRSLLAEMSALHLDRELFET